MGCVAASQHPCKLQDSVLLFSLLELTCELLRHLLYHLLSHQLCFNLIESLGEFPHGMILVLLPRRSPAMMLG